jgi:hypothetical protein
LAAAGGAEQRFDHRIAPYLDLAGACLRDGVVDQAVQPDACAVDGHSQRGPW